MSVEVPISLPEGFPRVSPKTVEDVVGEFYNDPLSFTRRSRELMISRDPHALIIIQTLGQITALKKGVSINAVLTGGSLTWRMLQAENPDLMPIGVDTTIDQAVLRERVIKTIEDKRKENPHVIRTLEGWSNVLTEDQMDGFLTIAFHLYDMVKKTYELQGHLKPN